MTPMCLCGHSGDVHLGTEIREDFTIPVSAVQAFAPFACVKCPCADFREA